MSCLSPMWSIVAVHSKPYGVSPVSWGRPFEAADAKSAVVAAFDSQRRAGLLVTIGEPVWALTGVLQYTVMVSGQATGLASYDCGAYLVFVKETC